MNYKTSKKGQRGQALILIAFAAVGLFAFSALAIDGSRAFSNKRQAQNAADTAALTAALTYIRDTSPDPLVKFQNAEQAALRRAESNGFYDETDGIPLTQPNVQVYVQRCDESSDEQTGETPLKCDGIDAAYASEYIRVRIVSTIPTTFGRVIGRQTLTSAAEAIARVQGSTSNSSGNSSAGAAMVSTKDADKDQCFLINGDADLETHNSGIFVNCGGSQALFINGSSDFTMGADSQVVGCALERGDITGGDIKCDATKLNVGPSTYANVPTMPPAAASSNCEKLADGSNLRNGSKTNNADGTVTLHWGKFTDLIIDKPTTMEPGVYCTNGAFNVQGQGSLTGTGTVKIVLPSSDFNVASNRVFTFNDLEVFTINNDFQLQGTLTANRFRFYSAGTGASIMNAQSSITSSNAYFYLHRGTLRWNGNTKTVLTAPPATGDAFPDPGGVLVYMPWQDPRPDGNGDFNAVTTADFNGGSQTLLKGTFLMPSTEIKFNGGTTFELHTQIIAYEYIVNGGGKIDIYYLSSGLINPPNAANPTIELTK